MILGRRLSDDSNHLSSSLKLFDLFRKEKHKRTNGEKFFLHHEPVFSLFPSNLHDDDNVFHFKNWLGKTRSERWRNCYNCAFFTFVLDALTFERNVTSVGGPLNREINIPLGVTRRRVCCYRQTKKKLTSRV